MEIGIDSFASNMGSDGKPTTNNNAQLIKELQERIEHAYTSGRDVFGIDE